MALFDLSEWPEHYVYNLPFS
jgi:hypothetical protein